MARMSLEKLNELLARAVASLQDNAVTLVELDKEPFKPYLPESYWAEQEARKREVAQRFNTSLSRARAKAMRELEDNKRAEVSVADLMDEWDQELPTLQGDNETLRQAGWGTQRMSRAPHARRVTPSTTFQPRYDYECALCGLPITNTTGPWRDHAGREHCDEAIVTWDMDVTYGWHMPKPKDGEELDE